MDCSLPVSSIHGILQARILEWIVIPFSRGSSWPRDWTWISCTAGRLWSELPGKPPKIVRSHLKCPSVSTWTWDKIFFATWICRLLTILINQLFLLFGGLCCAACKVWVPWPGIEPMPPALECDILTTGTQGKPQQIKFYLFKNLYIIYNRIQFVSERHWLPRVPLSYWEKKRQGPYSQKKILNYY